MWNIETQWSELNGKEIRQLDRLTPNGYNIWNKNKIYEDEDDEEDAWKANIHAETMNNKMTWNE